MFPFETVGGGQGLRLREHCQIARANAPDFNSQSETPRWPRHNRAISALTPIFWGPKDTTYVSTFLDEMPRYASKLSVSRLLEVGHMTLNEKSEQSSKEITLFLHNVCVHDLSVSC